MVNYIRKFREDTDLSSLFQQSAPDNVRLFARFLAHLNTTPFYQSGTPVHFNRYQTEEELDHAISLQSKPE